ncbi:MAG: alkaline phosphatase, partial [Clostridia bacterium]|nr:alkaline phosphatase [Clostridia bacterium]
MKRITALFICLLMIFASVPVSYSRTFTHGDVNGDGRVSIKDSLLLRRYIAGLDDDISGNAADVNSDGNVTTADVLMLRRHLAGWCTVDETPVHAYISDIEISGVSIADYNIVIPEDYDLYTLYAAELLKDYINDKSYIRLPILTDASEETPYEFLIGETNREESLDAADAVTLEDDEYLLMQDGSKIVMLGNAYMIGGGVGKFTYDYVTYDSALLDQALSIDTLPTAAAATPYTALPAKNTIFMIGDGMGEFHPQYSLELNQRRKWEPDFTEFCAYRLPNIGYVTTYSLTTVDSGGKQATDSAAAGTALACGIKTYNKRLGLDSSYYPHQNIRELAASLGKRNAVMTTERKEGATPAAFTVHFFDRSKYDLISSQQNTITDCDYLKGDIEDNILQETRYALDLLSTNNDAGFFVMIEEAHIDKYSHNNQTQPVVHAVARFNSAIRYAMVFAVAHPDTLLLITADHECGGLLPGV